MQEQTKNRAILNRFEQWSCPINPVRAWPVMGMRRTCSHPGLSIHARSRASSMKASLFVVMRSQMITHEATPHFP